jgi:anti-sigma factor RsiW
VDAVSGALEKAEQAAREAAANTEITRLVAAVLAAQQLHNQQPAPVAPAPPPARRPVGLYIAAGIGGACALSFLALAAALLAVAVAIGGVCATVCLLVLRGLWTDYQNQKRK